MNQQKALWVVIIIAATITGFFIWEAQRDIEAPLEIRHPEQVTDNIENPGDTTSGTSQPEAPKGKLAPGTAAPGTAEQVRAHTWVWTKTVNGDGTTVTPNKPGIFTLTFDKSGRVSGKTDCNGFGGDYQIGSDGIISFGAFMSTLMFCEGSQESVYSQAVMNTTSYSINASGELVLHMKDKGVVYFKKQ